MGSVETPSWRSPLSLHRNGGRSLRFVALC
jgi:hypothetical protein